MRTPFLFCTTSYFFYAVHMGTKPPILPGTHMRMGIRWYPGVPIQSASPPEKTPIQAEGLGFSQVGIRVASGTPEGDPSQSLMILGSLPQSTSVPQSLFKCLSAVGPPRLYLWSCLGPHPEPNIYPLASCQCANPSHHHTEHLAHVCS